MIYYFRNPAFLPEGAHMDTIWYRKSLTAPDWATTCLNCRRRLGVHLLTTEGNGLICRPQPRCPDTEALSILERLDRLSELVV